MTKEWGPLTWRLLHCISLKVDETYFDKNIETVLQVIVLILTGLPCPDCSKHSSTIFANNRKKIKTKKDLQNFLHYLNNKVNKKLKKKEEDISILEKYKEYDIKRTIEKWSLVYGPPKNIPKLMANNMHITIIRNKLIIYFINNIKYYI